MSTRCTCPGLNISPDCPLHSYDPSEDEPERPDNDPAPVATCTCRHCAGGGWLYDHDLQEARIHQTLAPDELED